MISDQEDDEKKETEAKGIKSLLYTHPDTPDSDSGMEGLVRMAQGLKLSEVYMEAEEMRVLNEIMNNDDLDSDEEEFLLELGGRCTNVMMVVEFYGESVGIQSTFAF